MKTAGKNIYRKKPNGRYEYLRVCGKCGDKRYIASIPKDNAVCKKCSSTSLMKQLGKNNKKKEEDRVHYWYFCPTCTSVRDLDEKRKSPFCGTCNRKKAHKVFPYYFFDYDLLKIRTYHVNPTPLPIVKKTKVKKQKVVKPKPKPKQKRKYSLSKNANNIDPIALAKVREKNRRHRLEEEKKSKVKKTVQRKTDAQLIAEFLQNNEPSVKVSTEPLQDIYYGEVYISPRLEWA